MNNFLWTMTKVFSVLLLGLFVGLPHASAAGWAEVADASFGSSTYYCIDFSSSFGVAVGSGGRVMVSNDTGSTWTAATDVSTSITYYGCEVLSSTVAIVTGVSGKIYRTDDAGATWDLISTGTTYTLYTVDMITSSVGWAAGAAGKVMKTYDGGLSWISQSAGAGTFTDLVALSSSSALMMNTSHEIWRTVNGTDWSLYATNAALSGAAAFDALSTSTLFIGDTNEIAYSTNSGATWANGTGSFTYVADIDMYNATQGLLVGGSGGVFQTTDGAHTWTAVSAPQGYSGTLYNVWAYAGLTSGWATGSGGVFRYDATAPGTASGFAVTTAATVNTPTFGWDAATDAQTSVASYEIAMDGGAYTNIGNVESYLWPSAIADGAHTFTLRAIDAADNVGSTVSSSITISTADVTGPTVTASAEATATVGTAFTMSAIASDASGVVSCSVFVEDYGTYAMTFNIPMIMWSASMTPTMVHDMYYMVTCIDGEGNDGSSATGTVVVSAAAVVDEPVVDVVEDVPVDDGADSAVDAEPVVDDADDTSSDSAVAVPATTSSEVATDSEASAGNLIKIACDDTVAVDVNDPCKAVYYYGADAKRHAFPNERVFFTWYADFDSLVIVSADFMASLTLGRNITYHPGTKMVKFVTVNTVYAVGEDGALRAIGSEDIAASLYGANWNQHIDDISDAFFGNYRFGEDVDTTSDFDADEVESLVDSIDDLD